MREIIHKLDAILNLLMQQQQHFKPVACRFAGVYWINPKTGEIKVASQQVAPNTAITGPLLFADVTGKLGPGPKGTVTTSDGSPVTLSADGQAVNYTMGPPGFTVTITWKDPAGKIPSASIDLTDGPVPFQPVSVMFGAFTPGTIP